MLKKRKLEMSISLNALEHLGMNLYSNQLLISARSRQPPSIQSKSRSRTCLSCVFVRSTRSPFGYIANGYSI